MTSGKGIRGVHPIVHCPGCDADKQLHAKGMCGTCYHQEWRKANPARVQKSNKKKAPYRRAWVKAFYQKHPEKHREIKRAKANAEWQKSNRDQLAVNHKAWKQANPDKMRELIRLQTHRRQARLKGLPYTLTQLEWQAILDAYQHRCAYCGRDDVKMTQDHVIPVAHGGGYTADNLIPACKSCNCSRSDMSIREFVDYAKRVGRKFDPHPLLIKLIAIQ